MSSNNNNKNIKEKEEKEEKEAKENNNDIKEKEEKEENNNINGKEEKENKNNDKNYNKIQKDEDNGISKFLNYSKSINNSKKINNSSILYSFPIICVHNEKDPIDDYRLRVIKGRNKGSDTFLKNYLKFNFSKNDMSNNSIRLKNKSNINNININNLKEKVLENNKSNIFITEQLKNYQLPKTINSSISKNINNKNKAEDILTHKKLLKRSKSHIFNIYSPEAINYYKTLYLIQMEKRGNLYNKRKIASLQRIALHNFSTMNLNDGHFVNGSIPSGKFDESYILETKKRRKMPNIREYILYRLKSIRKNEINSPEYYYEKYKKNEKNRLPEIIDIKNSGRFRFHVFHDLYGFKKELDKRDNRELKMTRDKIRDLKVMSQINKINDPDLTDIYRRALYGEE